MKDIVDVFALKGFGISTISTLFFLAVSLLYIWRLMRTATVHRRETSLLAQRVKRMISREKEEAVSRGPSIA